MTDFKEKAEIFNSFLFYLFIYFLKKCSIIDNSIKLPSNLVHHTNEKLSDVIFKNKEICKVISGLGPDKAYGHEMISICMLKVCGESTHKPL